MCPPCRKEHRAELEQGWRAAREHRAARLQAQQREVAPMEDGQVAEVPKIRITKITAEDRRGKGRPPARVWTDEEKLEIGRLYEEGATYEAIQKATGANTQTISNVAKSLGLQRTKGPGSKAIPLVTPTAPVVPDVPPAQHRAIENMIDTEHVLRPKPEPLAHPVEAEEWRVRVEGTMFLRGSLEEIIARVKRDHPLLKITAIQLAPDA